MSRPLLLAFAPLSVFLASASGAQQAAAPAPARPNVVLIVIDDIGVEKLACYHAAVGGNKPLCTPNMDALAAEGLLFTQAWADPVCSPTRAEILTGRYGFRTGIGCIIEHDGDQSGLSAALETTLPEILTGYESALVGKWHLAHPTRDGLRHPIDCGFRTYSGTLFNIATPAIACGPDCTPPDCASAAPLGYSNWVKTSASASEPGASQTCVTGYATSVTADDAIARAQTLKAPWFLEVGFNAAHLPTEKPPPELAPSGEKCSEYYLHAALRADVMNAMIEALDTEIGRLVAALRRVDPSVTILLIADNGTSIPAAQGKPNSCAARGRCKGTVFQGGIRVPLIAAGPKITHGTCDALVSAADLYATIAELAGAKSTATDSVSLVPYFAGEKKSRRATVYAETFTPNFISPDHPGQPPFHPTSHSRALRNARYKLIRTTSADAAPIERLYDLANDPCEERDLLELPPGVSETESLNEDQRTNLEALRAELKAMGVY